jgi:hypothetical protein
MLPAWRLGLTDYQPRNYGPEPDRAYLIDALERLGERVWSRNTSEEDWTSCTVTGDVLLVTVRGHPSHLGYFTGEGTWIHGHGKHGVIERPIDSVTERAVQAVYRWRGLDEENECDSIP